MAAEREVQRHSKDSSEISDKDIARLIVLKPSKSRDLLEDGSHPHEAHEHAQIISDGLRVYESQLHQV